LSGLALLGTCLGHQGDLTSTKDIFADSSNVELVLGDENTQTDIQKFAEARTMVDTWLDQRGLAQYTDRIVLAFQEAEYKPHEWMDTLESMGRDGDELNEFIAALEKWPMPNEAGK